MKNLSDEPPEFLEEEVTLRNGPVSLAGTLVRPAKPARTPAIVVVHGSGDQGRDDGFYRFWGEFFAGRGVAALIYDKRGVGGSTGNHTLATFDDLASDAVAAVTWLKRHPAMRAEAIGLFGISQGGWIAPLAASRTEDVKFLILNVGPAVAVRQQELDRVEYTLLENEFTQAEIDEALDYTRAMFDTAYTGEGRDRLDALTRMSRGRSWTGHVDLIEADDDLDGWRRIRYDPAPVLSRMTIPLLALFGEADTLVPPATNRNAMENALREAGNRDVTIRVHP